MNYRAILIPIVCVVSGVASLRAQQPEEVPRLAQQYKSHEWYVAQVKLWKGEIDRDPTDAHAWYNYFKASRYEAYEDTASLQVKSQRMQNLLSDMERAIPNSFEAHFCKYWNGGNEADLFPELEAAYRIRQDYAEVSPDFVSYYELHGDYDKKNFFCTKWYETKTISPSLLNYNYNVLMSLDKDAILVTTGDNDTYPIWLLQCVKGIRPDVTVINTSLISIPEYRLRMMKEHGIKGDGALLDWDRMETTPYETCLAQFLQSLAESNKSRPFYVTLTVGPDCLTLIKENLYTVGLANRYSPHRIDNIAMLEKNWNQFRLDYLDLEFYGESYLFNSGGLQLLNMNYVTPALLLYEHYLLAGDEGKADRFRDLALQIGREGGQEQGVLDYLKSLQEGRADDGGQTDRQTASVAEPDRNEFADRITITPNPVQTVLTLHLPERLDADIDIVDMGGNILRTFKSDTRDVEVDVKELPSGTYILRVATTLGTASKSVQVTR